MPVADLAAAAAPAKPAMLFFVALTVSTAILVVLLLTFISKFASLVQWRCGLEVPQDQGKFSTKDLALAQENLPLTRQLQETKKELDMLRTHGLAAVTRPSTEGKTIAESKGASAEAILERLAQLDVFKSNDGLCWHAFEECVAHRTRTKVTKLRPCAVCARKLKTVFAL